MVPHEGHLDAGVDEQVEGRARAVEVVGVEGGDRAVHEVAESRIRERRGEAGRGDASGLLPRRIAQHDDPGGDRGDDAQRLGDGRARGQFDRRIPGHRLRLHGADRGVQLLQRQVLRQHPETTPTGEGCGEPRAGHRVHVGRHDRDGGARSVACAEVDRQAAGDPRTTRHEEDIRVGEVVSRNLSREAHTSTLGRRRGPRTREPGRFPEPPRIVHSASPIGLGLTLV